MSLTAHSSNKRAPCHKGWGLFFNFLGGGTMVCGLDSNAHFSHRLVMNAEERERPRMTRIGTNNRSFL
jgi:hypothetical protein